MFDCARRRACRAVPVLHRRLYPGVSRERLQFGADERSRARSIRYSRGRVFSAWLADAQRREQGKHVSLTSLENPLASPAAQLRVLNNGSQRRKAFAQALAESG